MISEVLSNVFADLLLVYEYNSFIKSDDRVCEKYFRTKGVRSVIRLMRYSTDLDCTKYRSPED